jgi:hypothetical protein
MQDVIAARQALADHFRQRSDAAIELAREAHNAGMKKAMRTLLADAKSSQKIATRASQLADMHSIMMSMQPGSQMGGDPMGGGMSPPQYAQGTPAQPQKSWAEMFNDYLQNMINPGGHPEQTQVADIQQNWNRGATAEPAFDPLVALRHWWEQQQGHGVPPGTHPGGQAIVGERGPEMVTLPPGSMVTPNPQTPGYAFGTAAQPGLGFGGPPRQGGFGGPSMFGPGAQMPQNPQQLQGPQIPIMDPNTGALNPNAAYGPGGQFSGNQLLQGIQLGGLAGGAYNPLGSQQASDVVRQSILAQQGARQAQAAKTADIYAAGDPAFRAYARLNAQNQVGSQAAEAYANAQAQNTQGGLDFARQAYLAQIGAITRRDPKQGTSIGITGPGGKGGTIGFGGR